MGLELLLSLSLPDGNGEPSLTQWSVVWLPLEVEQGTVICISHH